jgi:hypothetical protein
MSPVFDRAKTVHALDGPATVIGLYVDYEGYYLQFPSIRDGSFNHKLLGMGRERGGEGGRNLLLGMVM